MHAGTTEFVGNSGGAQVVKVFPQVTLTYEQAVIYNREMEAAREARRDVGCAISAEMEQLQRQHYEREADAERVYSLAVVRAIAIATGMLDPVIAVPPEVR